MSIIPGAMLNPLQSYIIVLSFLTNVSEFTFFKIDTILFFFIITSDISSKLVAGFITLMDLKTICVIFIFLN